MKICLLYVSKLLTDVFCYTLSFVSLCACSTLTGLEIWTLMLTYALSPPNHSVHCEMEYFFRTTNASSLLEMLMESFYVENKCDHLFSATAFLSWILRHFGALCYDKNTVNIASRIEMPILVHGARYATSNTPV